MELFETQKRGGGLEELSIEPTTEVGANIIIDDMSTEDTVVMDNNIITQEAQLTNNPTEHPYSAADGVDNQEQRRSFLVMGPQIVQLCTH